MTDPHLDTDAINRDKLAMLGQLTAGVAHELNNPVGYVASNLNTLGKYSERICRLIDELAAAAGADGAAILEQHRWQLIAEDLPILVEETNQGADLLKSLVADLKTLGRTSTAKERCDPTECIVSALNVLNHQLKHGFTVTRDFAALPAVNLVRPQIIQAVTNLVHNAIQAMGESGALRIATAVADGQVQITVEDSGPGIPPALGDRIFEAYVSTKPSSAGTGLGLAIVKRIMEEHGGTIGLGGESSLGGARFLLTLPVET